MMIIPAITSLSPRNKLAITAAGALTLVAIGGSAARIDWPVLLDAVSDAPAQAFVETSAPPTAEEQQALIALTHDEGQSAVEGADAFAINAALPFSTAPVIAARPFHMTGAAPADRERALQCMTQAVYYEAGFEPAEGKRAVAQVVLNRMRHPAFAKSVCGVVYEGATQPVCQFSFTCDGSLTRAPAPRAWAEARKVATAALNGAVEASVGLATHYHADYVSPYWAPRLTKLVQHGAHIFYRWPGGWGTAAAFTGRYTGVEAIPSLSATDELLAETPLVPERAPTERRADNDIGGRLDMSKGWQLNIPSPAQTRGALASITAEQGTDTPAQAVTVASNDPIGG
ncbi:cell wall hydrolase [Sphingomonas sp. C3-2]|uniref:cell wall hydrolase n=1 Tax=Sphingomonas sp. C3-2 TaxID=3062169 RepID=UPI00294AEE5A|nr:cell wall hydrolase [Sphingomonas sp. C3-2]WOK38143.1 cell wall hydrolase [Sphingomonas sp. C3-2]